MRAVSFFLGFTFFSALMYFGLFRASNVDVGFQVLAAQTEQNNIVELTSEQNEFLDGINQIREQNGLAELVYDTGLERVSEHRVNDMSQNQYYSHKFLGTNYTSLFRTYTVESTSSCENLQLQKGANIAEAISAWENSPPHYRCLINPKTSKIGYGYKYYSSVDDLSIGAEMYVFAMVASD
jgi:uncharacterized protein YkwD